MIALHVATKRSKLIQQEIQFLRTFLGHSRPEFAERLGVSTATVSRWENRSMPLRIPTVVERFIRYLVQTSELLSYFHAEKIENTAVDPARTDPIKLLFTDKGWTAATNRSTPAARPTKRRRVD